MKKYLVIFLSLFAFVGVVSADPRMETNDNFCHFTTDPDNTDNEPFQGGCDSTIIPVDGVAVGSAFMVKKIHAEALLHAGITKRVTKYTSDDSDAACIMVDSNGTEYTSDDWESIVMVKKFGSNGGDDDDEEGGSRKLKKRRLYTVVLELICRNGN